MAEALIAEARTTVLEKESVRQTALREYEEKCASIRDYNKCVSALVAEFGTVDYFDGYDYKAARKK